MWSSARKGRSVSGLFQWCNWNALEHLMNDSEPNSGWTRNGSQTTDFIGFYQQGTNQYCASSSRTTLAQFGHHHVFLSAFADPLFQQASSAHRALSTVLPCKASQWASDESYNGGFIEVEVKILLLGLGRNTVYQPLASEFAPQRYQPSNGWYRTRTTLLLTE